MLVTARAVPTRRPSWLRSTCACMPLAIISITSSQPSIIPLAAIGTPTAIMAGLVAPLPRREVPKCMSSRPHQTSTPATSTGTCVDTLTGTAALSEIPPPCRPSRSCHVIPEHKPPALARAPWASIGQEAYTPPIPPPAGRRSAVGQPHVLRSRAVRVLAPTPAIIASPARPHSKAKLEGMGRTVAPRPRVTPSATKVVLAVPVGEVAAAMALSRPRASPWQFKCRRDPKRPTWAGPTLMPTRGSEKCPSPAQKESAFQPSAWPHALQTMNRGKDARQRENSTVQTGASHAHNRALLKAPPIRQPRRSEP